MKLLTSLLLLCVYCSPLIAQKDSCSIKISFDKTANSKRAETSLVSMGSETDNLFCSGFRTGGDFGIYFGLELLNTTVCFTPGNKALIIFTDHTQAQLNNIQSSNCNGNFLVKGTVINGEFVSKDAVLDQLTKKIMKAIRFQTTSGYLDYDVSETDDKQSSRIAAAFQKSLLCLKEWDPAR